MQATSGSDEPMAPGDGHSNAETYFGYLVWYARVAAVAYLIIILVAALRDDLTRTKVLYGTIRVCQTVARTVGGWALEAEQTYNEHVESLH